jgi:hypothetical protein
LDWNVDEEMNMSGNQCKHNQRCRYTTGFFCEECKTFVKMGSDEYFMFEGFDSWWMVIHNIWCRLSKGEVKEIAGGDTQVALVLRDRIGVGAKGRSLNELRALESEAAAFAKKYGDNAESATCVLG